MVAPCDRLTTCGADDLTHESHLKSTSTLFVGLKNKRPTRDDGASQVYSERHVTSSVLSAGIDDFYVYLSRRLKTWSERAAQKRGAIRVATAVGKEEASRHEATGEPEAEGCGRGGGEIEGIALVPRRKLRPRRSRS